MFRGLIWYGCWLFLLGNINTIGVGAQNAVPTQVPSWYYGNSIKFVRYNDQQCSQLATSDYATPTSAIFGGLRTFSVPIRTDNCIKVPSMRFGQPGETAIRFVWSNFPGGQTGICHLGNVHMDWSTNIYMWAGGPNALTCMGGPSGTFQFNDPIATFMKDIDSCLRDTGDSQNALFYRAFCDISYPNSTTTVNTFTTTTVTNNITNTVTTPLNYTELTPFVRNIVKLEVPLAVLPLLPLLSPISPAPPPSVAPVLNQTELSSMVQTLVLKTLADNGFNVSRTLSNASLAASPNKAPNSGAVYPYTIDPALLVLCGIPLLFFFSLV